ncbi:hypothetical protein FF1_041858 [Malus domestica]
MELASFKANEKWDSLWGLNCNFGTCSGWDVMVLEINGEVRVLGSSESLMEKRQWWSELPLQQRGQNLLLDSS